MTDHFVLKITDKDGWRRAQPIQRRIVHIGSDAQNEIVLETLRGGGVAPRHLQLITVPDIEGEYRLVNLGDTAVHLGAAGDRVLAPRSAADIAAGEHIKVGDFQLAILGEEDLAGLADIGLVSDAPGPVRSAVVPSARASSRAIGLELFLPKIQLEPGQPIDGSVIVRNLGNKPAVQFKLAVEGLHPDCYDMGAGPLLFPNAEKEIYFSLFHPQNPNLLAGEHRFRIRAKAPEVYPEESVTISQVIHVLPYYRHVLRLVTTE